MDRINPYQWITDRMQQEKRRIETGIQCPECWGVAIQTRRSRFQANIEGFLCIECGCQWSPRLEQCK